MSCTCSHGPYTVTIPVGYQFTGVSSEFLIVQYCTVFVYVKLFNFKCQQQSVVPMVLLTIAYRAV